jgi:putative copper resistance protein D
MIQRTPRDTRKIRRPAGSGTGPALVAVGRRLASTMLTRAVSATRNNSCHRSAAYRSPDSAVFPLPGMFPMPGMLGRPGGSDDRFRACRPNRPDAIAPLRCPDERILASLRRVEHLREFASSWQLAPPLALMLITATTAYLVAVRSVTRQHPTQPWPVRHTAFFLSGIVLIVLVTLGPVGVYDDDFFWAHMTQHIVLMMAAAPLLLLGEPVLLLLRVSTRSFRQQVVIPVLRSRVMGVLTNPVVTWLIFASVLLGTHFTGFFEYALEHDPVHNYVEHPLYLGAGLLYFYPLLGTSPGASAMPPFAKVVSLFLMMLPEAMVGFAIYMAGSVLYAHYLTVEDRP